MDEFQLRDYFGWSEMFTHYHFILFGNKFCTRLDLRLRRLSPTKSSLYPTLSQYGNSYNSAQRFSRQGETDNTVPFEFITLKYWSMDSILYSMHFAKCISYATMCSVQNIAYLSIQRESFVKLLSFTIKNN